MTFRAARTGAFRHTLQVYQNANEGLDATGQEIVTPGLVGVVRASIEQLSGDEGILARQTYPTATHTIQTHYLAGINNQCWFTLGARKFHIENIDNLDERNRTLIITCTEER